MSKKSERRARRLARKASSSESKRSPDNRDGKHDQSHTSDTQPEEAQPVGLPKSELETISTAKADQRCQAEPKSWKTMFSVINWEIVSAIVVAIFTIIIAFATWYQWRATVAQNNIMIEQGKAIEKQAKLAEGQLDLAKQAIEQTKTSLDRTALQQRAWIAVGNPQHQELMADRPIQLHVTVGNTGQTPGFIIGHILDAVPLDDEARIPALMDIQVTKAKASHIENAVAVGQNINTFLKESNTPTQEILDAIKKGNLTLFLFGVVVYRDVFGELHETRHCFRYSVGKNQFLLNDKYNYMD
jgi:hypothetical protein